MHRKSFCHVLGAVTVGFLLILSNSCSRDEEQQVEEKGSIEKMTDRAADTAVKKIRTPMDKARATQDLGDKRMEEMDKALQKQE